LVKDKDLKLISGIFLEDHIPNDKLWLRRYFSSNIQKKFLSYIIIFESGYYFTRHTGIKCSVRYVKKMKKRYFYLVNCHKEAKNNFDLELLANIESGQFKCGT
jgi:hypothetical protein